MALELLGDGSAEQIAVVQEHDIGSLDRGLLGRRSVGYGLLGERFARPRTNETDNQHSGPQPVMHARGGA